MNVEANNSCIPLVISLGRITIRRSGGPSYSLLRKGNVEGLDQLALSLMSFCTSKIYLLAS
jgi:hypothetical protein